MLHVHSHSRADHSHDAPDDHIELAHDERHLRRKVLTTAGGESLLIDLPEATSFAQGDRLVLEDGRSIEIRAAVELLYEIVARDPLHLSELCWHLGNRHLPARIEPARILILRDHVIKAMLEGLGAKVRETAEPFQPVRGAYHSGHGHGHHHENASHEHGHEHSRHHA